MSEEEPFDDEHYYYQPEPDGRLRGWLVALIVIVALLILCCACIFATITVVSLLEPVVGGPFTGLLETLDGIRTAP